METVITTLAALAPVWALAGALGGAYLQSRTQLAAAERQAAQAEKQREHDAEARQEQLEREANDKLREERLQAHAATLAALWSLIAAAPKDTPQSVSQLGHAVALSAVLGGPDVRRTAPRAMWSVLRWVQKDDGTWVDDYNALVEAVIAEVQGEQADFQAAGKVDLSARAQRREREAR